MEDWKKYVFDPKNPTDFKAYKLLKKILKDGNTLLVTDMYYFNELFKKEIWTQDVIDELWDKPDNFHELSSNKKARVFKKNFSYDNYINLLDKRIDKFSIDKFTQLFSKFGAKFSNSWNLVPQKKTSAHEINKFIEKIYEIPQQWSIGSSYSCFYLMKNNPKGFLETFLRISSMKKLSVFFIDETTFINEFFMDKNFKNFHPVILRQEEDIHQLLDFLYRDISNETALQLEHKPETYLKSININNYFSIEDIKIKNLDDKKEIYLMGENGDGKTILLQAIVLALKGNQNIGGVIDVIEENPHGKMELSSSTSDGENYRYYINPKSQKKSFNPIIGYGIDRFRNDSDKVDETGYLSLFNKETYLENPEKWLQHLDYKESKGDISELSLSQATEILTDILERDVTITVTPDKVTFTEKGTTLNFHQLSDGYQSVIIWVCDLISRLSKLQPNASSTHDYSGVVIVDEIGAYLHPKWAYSIVKKLREWFPNLQFIFTTHNPIVILGASEDATFYKVYKEKGKTKLSEPVEDISDLMLNSLVTSPLFNLPTARPKGFDDSNDLSDDDYIYRRIHQLIQQKLQTMPNLVDDDVIKMIEAELEKV